VESDSPTELSMNLAGVEVITLYSLSSVSVFRVPFEQFPWVHLEIFCQIGRNSERQLSEGAVGRTVDHVLRRTNRPDHDTGVNRLSILGLLECCQLPEPMGIAPYYISSQQFKEGGWELKVQALFWSLRIYHGLGGPGSPGGWTLDVPLITRLKGTVWAAVRWLSTQAPPEGVNHIMERDTRNQPKSSIPRLAIKPVHRPSPASLERTCA
jgi:hypothetical protein